MKTIRVMLADDHTVVRQALRMLLDATGIIEVVAEAENGRKAVANAFTVRPEVVLMDVAMPLLNGYEATRRILKVVPSARVLAMSSYTNPEVVLQMIAAGAAGYVLKHTAANELVKAIQEVQKGNMFFSSAVARFLPPQGPQAQSRNRLPQLTARETEVLQLIAEGLVNKQIASGLNISIKTVEKHRQAVMDKLNLHDTAKLTHYAIANGIVECSAPTQS